MTITTTNTPLSIQRLFWTIFVLFWSFNTLLTAQSNFKIYDNTTGYGTAIGSFNNASNYLINTFTDNQAQYLWTDANGNLLNTETDFAGSKDQYRIDGSTYIKADAVGTEPNRDIRFQKINRSGAVTLSKTYPLSMDNVGQFTIPTSDGGFLITGATQVVNDTTYKVQLIKTNANGDMQWQKVLTQGLLYSRVRRPNAMQCNDIINGKLITISNAGQTSDGGFFLQYRTSEPSFDCAFGGGNGAVLIRLDANGNYLWHRADGSGAQEGKAHKVAAADNGNLLLLYNRGAGDTRTCILSEYKLIKLSPAGAILWSYDKSGNTCSPNISQNASVFGVFPNGDIALVTQGMGIIRKINGQTGVQTDSILVTGVDGQRGALAMTTLSDGTFAITGQVDGNAVWKTFFYKNRFFPPSVSNSCRYQDSLQLVSFYNATGGANWTNKWNLSQPMTTWYGVSLNANGCVEGIQLSRNNLIGTIPNLSLTGLKSLNLSDGKLTGAIPNFNLPLLQTLILDLNPLASALPNFNLPSLTYLALIECGLTGSIPNFNLPKLNYLSMGRNHFTGSIPNFNLPELAYLNLDNNSLTGNVPSFNLTKLEYAVLNKNKLTGSIPSFTYGTLKRFNLDSNNLSGCIPASLKTFCNVPGAFISFKGNPSLATQDFEAFCANNTGACGATLPDFRMTAITQAQCCDLTTTTYRAGIDGFGVNYTVINQGGAFAENLPVTAFFYLSTDTILDSRDSLFTTLFAGGAGTFAAGGTPPRLADGDYFLIGKANGDNAVAESNYNNNVFVLKTPKVKIRSGGLQDLALNATADKSNFTKFSPITFKIGVQNRSISAFTNVVIEFKFPIGTVSGGTVTPSVGAWQEWCAGGVQCYKWTIPNLIASDGATLQVPLFVLNPTSPIVATTNLLASTPIDANTANNSATISIPAAAVPQALVRQQPTQLVPVVVQSINPSITEGDISVELESLMNKTVRFDFYNLSGKIVKSETKMVEKGRNKLPFEVFDLPQGVYFIQTDVGTGKGTPTKFVKM